MSTFRKMSCPRLSTSRVIPIMAGRKRSNTSTAIKPVRKTPQCAWSCPSFFSYCPTPNGQAGGSAPSYSPGRRMVPPG